MISTAGAINAGIIICGEMPMAVAEDGLAHGAFARLGAGGSPQAAIIVSATLSSILLALNYSRGFIGAFQFLLMMSVVTILFPLVASVLAELRRSIGRSLGGTIIAALALAYCLFIIFGSGAESFFWGVVLTASGAPLYFLSRRRRPAAAAE
jgi:amino acid transporter